MKTGRSDTQRIFVHDHLFPQISSEEQFHRYVQDCPEFDPEYILQHCYIYRKETRDWLETIWEKFSNYAEPDFLIHVREQKSFHSFTWQMYLASIILDNNYNLQKNTGIGPDLQIKVADKNIWIEAVITTPGEDGKAAGLPQSGAIYDSLDPRVARISSALTEKHRIYKEKYLNSICKADEPFIIAINGSETCTLNENRAIESAVFGRGNDVLKRLSNGIMQGGLYEPREFITIQKNDRQITIPESYFCNDSYQEISGVIYCEQHIINANNYGRTPEGNLYFLINPYAKNKIDTSKFTIGNVTKMNEERQIIREY